MVYVAGDLGHTAVHNAQEAAWTAYVPVWNGGTGAALVHTGRARFIQRGKLVNAEGYLTTTTALGSGTTWRLSLPVLPKMAGVQTLGIAGWTVNNAVWYLGHLQCSIASAGAYAQFFRGAVESGVTASGDQAYWNLTYEAA